MLAAALLLAQFVASPARGEREVVVTARTLAATGKAWRGCIAQGCPPDREIAAALAHAENQFVAGDYPAADSTLGRTVARTGKYAREHPVAVGGLWRARSRIREHRGEMALARHAAAKSLHVLRDGLGRDDPRVLIQQLELAGILAKTGHPEAALYAYRAVADRARNVGNATAHGYALLSGAVLLTASAEVDPAGTKRARRAIGHILSTAEPELAPVRQAAGLLAAVLDGRRGDRAAIDLAIAKLSARADDRPTLIYSPQLGTETAEAVGTGRTLTGAPVGAFGDHWVDLGFWVRPDGGVGDVQILRSGGRTRSAWIDAVTVQVRGRRYAPLHAAAGSPGAFRVERVTWTSPREVFIGSRIMKQTGAPRVVLTDLTNDAAVRRPAADP